VPLWPMVFRTLKTAPPPAKSSKSSLRGAQRRGNPYVRLSMRRSNLKPHKKTINHRDTEAQRNPKTAFAFLCVSVPLWPTIFRTLKNAPRDHSRDRRSWRFEWKTTGRKNAKTKGDCLYLLRQISSARKITEESHGLRPSSHLQSGASAPLGLQRNNPGLQHGNN
jgi:hypothetical protein